MCGYMACEPRLSQVFLSGYHRSSKSAFATMRRADGWKTRSAFPSTKRTFPRPVEKRFGEAVGGFVCRNTAAVHCAPSTGTDWLAGRRPRSGSRKNAGIDAPQACPSMDDRLLGSRSWSVTLGTGRALPALPQSTSNGVPDALASSTGCADAGFNSYSVAQIAAEVGYESKLPFTSCVQTPFHSSSRAFPKSIEIGSCGPRLSTPKHREIAKQRSVESAACHGADCWQYGGEICSGRGTLHFPSSLTLTISCLHFSSDAAFAFV